jgi:hypothetical protein
MAKEYRTEKQFEEIIESMTNGNWSQAADECIEYGFYAHDLVEGADQSDWIQGQEDSGLETYKDLILLAELAAEKRYKK